MTSISRESGSMIERFLHLHRSDGRHQLPCPVQLLVQQIELVFACNGDHAARLHQRVLAETFRRMLKKGAARHGQPTDGRASIVFRKTGCGTASGVITALLLPFQEDDLRKGGEFPRRAGAGHTAANDENIGPIDLERGKGRQRHRCEIRGERPRPRPAEWRQSTARQISGIAAKERAGSIGITRVSPKALGHGSERRSTNLFTSREGS